MRAAVFHAPHEDLTIEDIDIDEPREREVLVKIMATGVCHSDLHFVEGLYRSQVPGVLGHEAAGVVERVGSLVTAFQPGDRVIACLSMFCGECERCLSGEPFLCTNRPLRGPQDPALTWKGEPLTQFAGLATYAEQILVHEHALVKIEQRIDFDRMALIGCGVTTGVGAVLNTADIEPGSSVAVYGAGGIGLSAIQGARIGGARMIIAVDIHEAKLGIAREFGATHTVDATSRDPIDEIRALTGGHGVDYSFEAIGLKVAAEQAYKSIRPGGTATIIGMIPQGQNIEISGSSMLSARKLQGSSMGSNRFRIDMPKYVDWYLQGKLMLDEMITRRGGLEDINEAFRAMKAGEVSRTVLIPG